LQAQNNVPAESKAACEKLQAVLDGLIADDKGNAPAKKKKKNKA